MYDYYQAEALGSIVAYIFISLIIGATVMGTYFTFFVDSRKVSDYTSSAMFFIMIGGWFCIVMMILKSL